CHSGNFAEIECGVRMAEFVDLFPFSIVIEKPERLSFGVAVPNVVQGGQASYIPSPCDECEAPYLFLINRGGVLLCYPADRREGKKNDQHQSATNRLHPALLHFVWHPHFHPRRVLVPAARGTIARCRRVY